MMKSRLLVLGLLSILIVENGFLMYFGGQFRDLKGEVYLLQQQVAQLRLWRSSMEKRGSAEPSKSRTATETRLPIARYLATLIVLEHDSSLALNSAQLDALQRQVDDYAKRSAALVPLQKQLTAMWAQPDALLNPTQKQYVAAHSELIDKKADELLVIMHREEGTLVDMLTAFVKESRGGT